MNFLTEKYEYFFGVKNVDEKKLILHSLFLSLFQTPKI
jgi:hypothetical protein